MLYLSSFRPAAIWRSRCAIKISTAAIFFWIFIWYMQPGPSRSSRGTDLYFGKLHGNIRNDTLGFEKIFVLNLPSRTDRRDALSLAAAFSKIKLDWINGVLGTEVAENALPPGERIGLSTGAKGSWRGHMNAIRTIVEQNLGSALILEDDTDWDVRLKPQLQTFALAARALLAPSTAARNPVDLGKVNPDEVPSTAYQKLSFSLSNLPQSAHPQLSPYGDDWDMLWVGHCGSSFRNFTPTKRILILDDPTVPSPAHLKPHPFATPDAYGTLYPPHTRVVHVPSGPSCSIAYALSQRGARKLLYEFGVKAFDKQIDFMLGDFCDNAEATINGSSEGVEGHGRGREESSGVCVTVQPPLFGHHFPEGAKSDIFATGGGLIRMVGTLYVRWSVRMNFGRLSRGQTVMYDQWPD
ncbi:hypothetical protein B0O99DRAFT_681043 [Bisporella sp. PMI_857]|nr:hypothetical protein B0O99DRAFT_681043 [Bisporella sp. PMI_857]